MSKILGIFLLLLHLLVEMLIDLKNRFFQKIELNEVVDIVGVIILAIGVLLIIGAIFIIGRI
jgi:succinate dehydrogenase/fumarate reductase cytochrome b subunit|tara:strand:- start:3389 stop:3574 length:186 start_codon:yes stop_codon:yes gene_type:complete